MIDFYAPEAGKAVTIDVPLKFIGEAPVEKIGGMINKVLHEVEVTCQPGDLPYQIEVDVTSLSDVDSVIHVSDLKTPKGVIIKTEPTDVVAVVSAEREDEPEPAAEPETVKVEEDLATKEPTVEQ